jgi:hypothetical protein
LSNFDVECICRAKALQLHLTGGFGVDMCGVKGKLLRPHFEKSKKNNKPGRTPQYKQKIGFDKKFTAVSDCANCAERKMRSHLHPFMCLIQIQK